MEYKKQSSSDEISCELTSDRMSLFPHQRFIRDYLQYKSPYRGLLVYHGLGVGKSCSSIAAAEMLLNFKKVVVMLPASLKPNYINEVIKCGNKYYDKTKHHWVKVLDGEVNYVSKKTMKANGGVWMIDEDKASNFKLLSNEAKEEVELQILDIVKYNYEFVNYNGVSEKYIKENFLETKYFDNKVIIIDEVHNFVSGVSNKSKITTALYKLLMNATNSKIILLSGTPIINKPSEIAYTINLIKGYEFLYTLELRETNENVLATILDSIPQIDTYQIQILMKTSKVHLSLIPSSFKRVNNKVSFSDANNLSSDEIVEKIIRTFEDKKIKFIKRSDTKFTPLPTSEEEFNKYFVDESDHSMSNKNLFMRRIMGSVSHFVNNDPRLYPTVITKHEDIFMSDYQYDKYVSARKEEKKLESKQNNSLFGNQVSVYKTYSRNICNFVFPEDILRPKPKDIKDLTDLAKQEEYMKQVNKALGQLTDSHLTAEGLDTYSPKFKKMLENISTSQGNVLVYSQFSTVEGIEIISRCLDLVGYGEFQIVHKSNGWDIQYDSSKKGYIKFGSDLSMDEKRKTEYKNIVLAIYNDEFDKLPDRIRNKLQGKSNLRGEVLQVLFITQSGAEGISLKNVRQVHVTEPYWNKNRIDQVIGRANRTCSHIALPSNERNVTTFTYAMKLTQPQILNPNNKMIINRYDKNFTTDEAIYNIANNKYKIISEFLECMKKVSVDCALNNPEVGCFSFPVDLIENNKAYTLDISKDTLDAYGKEATFEIKKKAMKITIKKMNKSFIYITDTGELFDYSLYMNTSVLQLVGYLKVLENNKYSIKLKK
jgi:hypothetical protein